jgi:hypothetical protein
MKTYYKTKERRLNIFGHEVKAVEEYFYDEYRNGEQFQSRCLRCCFYRKRKDTFYEPHICDYIRCSDFGGNYQTHFEIIN